MANREATCSFCGKDCGPVPYLVEGPGELHACCGDCFERRRPVHHQDNRPEEIKAPLAPQALVPRLIQAMEILQLPIKELQERILRELQEGPPPQARDTSTDDLAPHGEIKELVDDEPDIVVERATAEEYGGEHDHG